MPLNPSERQALELIESRCRRDPPLCLAMIAFDNGVAAQTLRMQASQKEPLPEKPVVGPYGEVVFFASPPHPEAIEARRLERIVKQMFKKSSRALGREIKKHPL